MGGNAAGVRKYMSSLGTMLLKCLIHLINLLNYYIYRLYIILVINQQKLVENKIMSMSILTAVTFRLSWVIIMLNC